MYGYSVQIYTQMAWRTKPVIEFLYEGKGVVALAWVMSFVIQAKARRFSLNDRS